MRTLLLIPLLVALVLVAGVLVVRAWWADRRAVRAQPSPSPARFAVGAGSPLCEEGRAAPTGPNSRRPALPSAAASVLPPRRFRCLITDPFDAECAHVGAATVPEMRHWRRAGWDVQALELLPAAVTR